MYFNPQLIKSVLSRAAIGGTIGGTINMLSNDDVNPVSLGKSILTGAVLGAVAKPALSSTGRHLGSALMGGAIGGTGASVATGGNPNAIALGATAGFFSPGLVRSVIDNPYSKKILAANNLQMISDVASRGWTSASLGLGGGILGTGMDMSMATLPSNRGERGVHVNSYMRNYGLNPALISAQTRRS